MIDCIVTWPTSCDYPIWREFIRMHRSKFNRVFVAFMDTRQDIDFTAFIRESMRDDAITFIDPDSIEPWGDWRNNAVNKALQQSSAEWVWFTEQDFFMKDEEEFFAMVSKQMAFSDVIYFKEGDRIHPACLFARREVIESTRKDFSPVPDVGDHFCKFTDDLKKQNIILTELYGVKGLDYFHMNGLTHNYYLVYSGQTEHIYKREDFLFYNERSRWTDIEQDERFIEIMQRAVDLLT